MIVSIAIAVIIFLLAVWIIGMIPVPASPLPIKTILYVIAVILLVLYLLRFLR